VARSFNKVFGIGLSKTGTTSLTEALKLLSLNVEHFVFDYDLEELDGVTDTPVVRDYKTLDEQFPGSKFILTGRSMEEWLLSCSYHLLAPAKDPRVQQLRMDIYGCEKFDKERFRAVYLRHKEDVLRHFAHRPWDLLEMDICAGDGWGKLCPFLGYVPPKVPFPTANRTESSSKFPIPVEVNNLKFLSSQAAPGHAVLELQTRGNPIRAFLTRAQIIELATKAKIAAPKIP